MSGSSSTHNTFQGCCSNVLKFHFTVLRFWLDLPLVLSQSIPASLPLHLSLVPSTTNRLDAVAVLRGWPRMKLLGKGSPLHPDLGRVGCS